MEVGLLYKGYLRPKSTKFKYQFNTLVCFSGILRLFVFRDTNLDLGVLYTINKAKTRSSG